MELPMDRAGYIFKGTLLLVIGIAACDQELDAVDVDDVDRAMEPADSEDVDGPVDALVDEADDPVPITGTHKICSVVTPGNWRDTLVVPQGWTSSDCNSYRSSVSASAYQLGCITNSTYYWGNPGGADPNPNPCNW
jgi:hypothetical protein